MWAEVRLLCPIRCGVNPRPQGALPGPAVALSVLSGPDESLSAILYCPYCSYCSHPNCDMLAAMGRERERFRKSFRAVPVKPGPVYSAKLRERQTKQSVLMAGTAFMAVFGGGLILTNWAAVSAAVAPRPASPQFGACGIVRQTCVIDGDTFWLDGEKIRIADIDTPEISEPKCDGEYERGIEARDRLISMLNEGPFDVVHFGGRDEDEYGRKLRVVLREGQSLGDQLVGEGLARTWTGRREPWC